MIREYRIGHLQHEGLILIHFSNYHHNYDLSTTEAPGIGFIKAILIVVAFDDPVSVCDSTQCL